MAFHPKTQTSDYILKHNALNCNRKNINNGSILVYKCKLFVNPLNFDVRILNNARYETYNEATSCCLRGKKVHLYISRR